MPGTGFVCVLFTLIYKAKNKLHASPFQRGFANYSANAIFALQNLKLYALFVYFRVRK